MPCRLRLSRIGMRRSRTPCDDRCAKFSVIAKTHFSGTSDPNGWRPFAGTLPDTTLAVYSWITRFRLRSGDDVVMRQ